MLFKTMLKLWIWSSAANVVVKPCKKCTFSEKHILVIHKHIVLMHKWYLKLKISSTSHSRRHLSIARVITPLPAATRKVVSTFLIWGLLKEQADEVWIFNMLCVSVPIYHQNESLICKEAGFSTMRSEPVSWTMKPMPQTTAISNCWITDVFWCKGTCEIKLGEGGVF